MENKSKLNTVLLVIIIILLVAGLFYIILGNSKQKENNSISNLSQEIKNNITSQEDINKTTQKINPLETLNSLDAGYSVSYPSSWPVQEKSNSENYNRFVIKNSLNATVPGANSVMGSNDSLISIVVSYGIIPNGIDYSKFKTIDELLKDPIFGLRPETLKSRLSNVNLINIGGQNLRVEKMSNTKSETYSFVYNSKVYSITIMSGSQSQYNIDHKIFTELMSSFVLN